MKQLHLDYETFSLLDVRKVGSFRYSEDPSTEILMAAYALGDGDVKVYVPEELGWYPNADGSLEELYDLMYDCDELWAHNAVFEYNITVNSAELLPSPPISRYRCTAAIVASLSLPRALSKVSPFLGLKDVKNAKGAQLIRKFSSPRKPTKNNPDIRTMPNDDPSSFMDFIEYCRQDVVTERAVHKRLCDYSLTSDEQRVWGMDFEMNNRGIPIDKSTVKASLNIITEYTEKMTKTFRDITGLNPSQRDKVLQWCNVNGLAITDLQAKTLDNISVEGLSDILREVVGIRRSLGRSSTKKLKVMLETVSPYDDRIRGTLLYHGASTGRWSGRLVQPHNFPRGNLKPDHVMQAIELIQRKDPSWVEIIFGDPMEVVSSCLRGLICAPKGRELVVADYSAIEARVVCWLAEQEDVLDLYRHDEDAYIDMAAFVFKRPKDQINGAQRKLGKDIVLGCGFSMGWETFMKTCINNGTEITPEMAKIAVASFRERYPKVTKYWSTVDKTVKRVIESRLPETLPRGIRIFIRDIFLFIQLPSGRLLAYPYPSVEMKDSQYGAMSSIKFKSVNEKDGSFQYEYTYGGKLVENITQAVARDVMTHGAINAESNGYQIITTIHDELVAEVPQGFGDVKEFEKLICDLPGWAHGLPIVAKGYRAMRYRK